MLPVFAITSNITKSWCKEKWLFLLSRGTQRSDWHFLREAAPFPNPLIHCEWGELPSSAGPSGMSLICTSVSRETGSLTDSYCTSVSERWEMWCLKLLHLCSHPFPSQPWTCCLRAPGFGGSASMKLLCKTREKLREPVAFVPIQIEEDACFAGLQVLRKSTQPPRALAICISLFNIISAVIKRSDR